MNGPLGLLEIAAEAPVPLLRRLLVATDGLDTGGRVVDFAIELAKRQGSELTFSYVIDRAAAIAEATTVDGNDLLVPLMEVLDRAADHILGYATRLTKANGIACESVILDGHPVHAIVRHAGEMKADAIVMGTNGLTGLQRSFAGSVADGVLRLADAPVFVVSPEWTDTARSFADILVAVDDCEASRAAADFAAALGRADASRVIFCQVVQTGDLFVQAARFDLDPEPMVEEAMQAAKTFLDGEIARVAMPGSTFESSAIRGRPAEQIVAEAVARKAGLIAIGTHGRRGIHRMWMGSVAEDVIRRSPIPVVVVRRPLNR